MVAITDDTDASLATYNDDYLAEGYPGDHEFISAKAGERKIVFCPNVFQVPDFSVETDLVAVMMLFSAEFNNIFHAVKRACAGLMLRCLRPDDIWKETAIIQDVLISSSTPMW
jgi:hypothetical protein